MDVAFAQRLHQAVDRLQQRARVSIHSIDGIPMHRRQRCLLVTLQELADADDHIQRRPHLMADRFQEFRVIDVVGKESFVNAGWVLWDINWLHFLILSARINKGLRGCETSALIMINSRAHRG